jgi:hypothetical protein
MILGKPTTPSMIAVSSVAQAPITRAGSQRDVLENVAGSGAIQTQSMIRCGTNNCEQARQDRIRAPGNVVLSRRLGQVEAVAWQAYPTHRIYPRPPPSRNQTNGNQYKCQNQNPHSIRSNRIVSKSYSIRTPAFGRAQMILGAFRL